MRAEVSLQEDQGRQVDFDTETPKTGAANETTEEHASLESTVPETSSCKNGTIQARTQRDGYTDWFFRRASYLVLAHPRPRLLSSSTRLPRGACWMAFFTRGPP
ncbi:hypothetical protein B0T18DRAFT_420174 [Schizothecium vesticola]|uniref:Uncharacterized protein n=1 Tax=Schizothecium vesticola TaxID=314040 RepID=A0AA40K0T5_9PEZI|nr:hypothetical protein B0T18DRAFT_420174 [Schizothecium vesticola]